MKRKKWLAVLLAVCLIMALTGCDSSDTAVYVQSVADLVNLGGIAPGDRFPGIVVSENVTEIQKDADKTVGELLVKTGDDVTEGQELFSYDTEQLQLTLDKQRLELDQLLATIENYKAQIADLEKDRKSASSGDKLQYTIQIQALQVELKEAELGLSAKENAVAQTEALLENVTVVSPVAGRIQSINENGVDSNGNSAAYIIIQQSGSYRVKGTIGELQLGSIMEGTRIKIISRTDEAVFWMGTVTLVDYENPTQGKTNYKTIGGSGDGTTVSSNYPFYVELDSAEGLILGQHVYLAVDTGEEDSADISISNAFICYGEDGSTFVWAENQGKLEKRAVTVGEYNYILNIVEILEGLTETDYIAFPDSELCAEGVATTHNQPVEETEGVE